MPVASGSMRRWAEWFAVFPIAYKLTPNPVIVDQVAHHRGARCAPQRRTSTGSCGLADRYSGRAAGCEALEVPQKEARALS